MKSNKSLTRHLKKLSPSTETSQKANAETTYPLTIKTYDAKGNEVEQVFDKAPEKVITNNLSTTEILLELGLKDKIVGMLNPDNAVTDKYKDAIATIPQIGDKKTVSQETVLSYEPDAVMGRNKNPWGQLALGMKTKSQFIRKKPLFQQFSKIWEIL